MSQGRVFGIGLRELIVGILAFLVIVAIVIAIVVGVRCRRRHGDKRYEPAPCDDTENQLTKKCTSEESLKARRNMAPPSPDSNNPPPVPKRPNSYTPSNNDILANGLSLSGSRDNAARHYGSAAEDLNNMGGTNDMLGDVNRPLLNHTEDTPGPPPRKSHSQHRYDPNINFPTG